MRPRPGRLAPTTRVTPGKVSVVVLNWNARPFLTRALESIARHTRGSFELVIVDNGSTDDSRDAIAKFGDQHTDIDLRTVLHDENLYFSQGFNTGFNASAPDSEYVVVFCNDVEVKEDGWLERLVAAIDSPRTIAAGHVAHGYALPPEHRELFERTAPDYGNPPLQRKMQAAMADPHFRYAHLFGYCFLLNKPLLAETGLYMEGGDYRQYHSDWEWYVRFAVLGFEIASMPPAVHHWHSVSELIEFHPELYRDLVAKLGDEALVERYLTEGRPLYPAESAYLAHAAAQGGDDG